jgi:hypothetical protein
MSIVAQPQQDQIKPGRISRTELMEQLSVGLGALQWGGQRGGDRVEAGLACWSLSQQRLIEHASVTGRMIHGNPAFIAKEQVNSRPWQVFLTQALIGSSRCLTSSQGNLGTISFSQSQIYGSGNGFRTLAGQVFSRSSHNQMKVTHDSHSVWKLPG